MYRFTCVLQKVLYVHAAVGTCRRILASQIFFFCVFVGVKRIKSERRKKQKTIKKKANLMARANHLMELTDRINDLKTKCTV